MDIKTYLQKHGLSQKQFGALVGVTQPLVSRWVKDRLSVTPQKAAELERKTRGAIKRHDLRPDIFDKTA